MSDVPSHCHCGNTDAGQIACLLHSTLPPTCTVEDMESLVDPVKGITNESSNLKPPTVKCVLAPTSLSASEWNSVSSATNAEGKKQHFGMLKFAHPADLIVLDPDLAATAPEMLWLSSGIRAVDHCVETLCNPITKDYPEAISVMESGLRSLLKGLWEYHTAKKSCDSAEIEVAATYGELPYRSAFLKHGISKCQWGARDAMMGILIWHIPMGASHAIGHQIGSVAGVMHGITSCICLAPVLRYTKDRNPEAQKMVLGIFNEMLGWHETEAGDCVERFVKTIGLSTRLSEVGVKDDKTVEKIAEKTMTDAWGGKERQLEYDEVLQILNMVR